MAQFRLLQDAYMPRQPGPPPRVELLANGQTVLHGARPELLGAGETIECDICPGPHAEPVDDAARELAAEYWKRHPAATLDPTRTLPLGVDPLAPPTVEGVVLARLNQIEAERQAQPADSELLQLLAKGQAQLTDSMNVLTSAMAELARQHAGGRR